VRIHTRIFLCFLLVVGGGFAYLVHWVQNDLRRHYLEAAEEPLVDTANVLAALTAARAGDGAPATAGLRAAFDEAGRRTFNATIYDLRKTHVDLRVYVTDAKGVVVFDSDGGRDEGEDYSQWRDVYLTLRGRYGARSTRSDPDNPATSTLHVGAPVVVDGRTVGVLTVCKPTRNLHLFLDLAKGKVAVAGTLVALSAILVGVLVSFWVTLPIRRLTRYAAAVRDGKRTALPSLGRNDIGVMGRALEEMREALEGKRYVEQYVQTLTHEMKGPLSGIRGAAELLDEEMPPDARRRFLANIRKEAGRLQDMIDRMLALAALESRQGLRDVETVDLAAMAAEAAESLAPRLAAKGVRIERRPSDAVTVRGERFLLRQAVANLLENALAFTPAGGTITLAVEKGEEGATLSVTDAGPGVPDYALPRVFDKFYSLRHPDTGAKSTGLGLTFVREVARLHGGDARLANRPGGGAVATLAL
jgi:two-component system sensor histidine kinase CreC